MAEDVEGGEESKSSDRPKYISNREFKSDYVSWPSAEGRETISPDFKPTVKTPLPSVRCYYVRPDGTRCKRFGIRGTGLNGRTNNKAMCFTHGGSLPAVQAAAKAHVEAARMRLIENADLAVDTLLSLTSADTAAQVRLKASTEILDRIGLKGGADVTVDVNHNVSYADELSKKMKAIRERLEPEDSEDVVEAEVVDPETDE